MFHLINLLFNLQLVWIVTCLAVILSDVELGLLVGFVVALLSVLWRTKLLFYHFKGVVTKMKIMSYHLTDPKFRHWEMYKGLNAIKTSNSSQT